MLYLGIDQHSKQLTMNVREESGQIVQCRQVGTRGDAVSEFLTRVAEQSGGDGYAAIVEVCGFNDWLLDLLPERGCRHVVLVQPRQSSPRKTDRRDANQLCEVLWVNRHRLLAGQRVQGLRRVNIPGEDERNDRRLTALRQRAGRERTRVINRVHTVLRRRNRQHDCPTKTIQTLKAKAWLASLAVCPLDRLELDQCLARWHQLDEQQRVLDEAITRRVAQSADARLLRTLPGAGDFMALGLAAHVGDIRRFARPRSLANYWGHHAELSQLGNGDAAAWLDQQGRQHTGAVPVGTTRDARAQAGRAAADMVFRNQTPPRREDRAGCRDAAADDDRLAHADTSRNLSPGRRAS